jgi:hypothetical protein
VLAPIVPTRQGPARGFAGADQGGQSAQLGSARRQVR